MPDVVVNANSWVSLEEADDYLDSSVLYGDWNELGGDEQARALISAFRILDRANWAGAKTDPDQPTSHPRSGLLVDGVEVADDEVHQLVKSAQIEYAALIGSDASLASSVTGDASAGTKRLKAGSAEIEYFNNNPNARIASSRRYPSTVHELIGAFLKGVEGASLSGLVSGNDGCSSFEAGPPGLSRGFA